VALKPATRGVSGTCLALVSAVLSAFKPRPPRTELYAHGRRLRDRCPRGAHATWRCAVDRADPVRLLRVASARRIPELVPLRYGRMLRSPFLFYRGDLREEDSRSVAVVGTREASEVGIDRAAATGRNA